MNIKYYEPRFIKNSKNNIELLFSEEESKQTLLDLSKNNDKIVLLGNPGIGKTTELLLLFEKLWELKDVELNFPFFINLKNFRLSTEFEDLILFEEWKELPSITFILDGLDEISNINDFISELEIFLKKYEDKKINVVISCRTNIYEKYIVKIFGFKYFYLDSLNDKQINKILENKCNSTLKSYNRGRSTYQQIVPWLLVMMKIESKRTETQFFIKSLYDHIPRLPALKDEITKAGLLK